MSFSSENVVNIALRRMGYPTPIGNLYEGSPAARAMIDVYAETVMTLLRAEDHEFSRKSASLSSTGNTPPFFWSYEYLYPVDCLRVRQVVPTTRPNPPVPILWDVGTALITSIQTTVIWSNAATPTLVYTTSAVTEADWDPGFLETVVQYLVMAAAPGLAPKDDKGTMADHVEMARLIRSDVGKDS